ncbi:hypothetical protein ABS767_03090 [Sphingomonas sp. ST-64]|uniref:Lipoprotein n=1 Tax=Sphingomonas plantiphila TaxID=3163295 RepID=A0ABW8YI50_9SPHN
MRRIRPTILLASIMVAACAPAEPPRACTPPRASWGEPHPHGLMAASVVVTLDRNDKTYWMGKPASAAKITEYLRTAYQLSPQPPVQFEVEMGASCKRLDELRSLIEREYRCGGDGHCDEGSRTIGNLQPSKGPVT